jgi:hypothetical protein
VDDVAIRGFNRSISDVNDMSQNKDRRMKYFVKDMPFDTVLLSAQDYAKEGATVLFGTYEVVLRHKHSKLTLIIIINSLISHKQLDRLFLLSARFYCQSHMINRIRKILDKMTMHVTRININGVKSRYRTPSVGNFCVLGIVDSLIHLLIKITLKEIRFHLLPNIT